MVVVLDVREGFDEVVYDVLGRLVGLGALSVIRKEGGDHAALDPDRGRGGLAVSEHARARRARGRAWA